MKKRKSIKYNFIMNTMIQGSAYIMTYLLYPYVSRILLPIGMGKVSFTTSVITYFTMFAMLGIPTYGIRSCASVSDDKEKLSKTVQEIFAINISMCAVAYFVLFLAIKIVPRLQKEKVLVIVMSSMIMLSSIGMDWVYKGLEQYAEIAIRSLVVKSAAFIMTFWLVRKPEDYIIYGLLYAVSMYGANVWNFLRVRKYISFTRYKSYDLRQHIKPILVFFSMSVATTVYTNLDVVMLGMLTGDVQTGYYDAAIKVKTILVMAATSIGVVLLPRVSYYVTRGMHESFIEINKKVLHLVILCTLPLVCYFILLAEPTMLLLSGKEFYNAISAMKILMPTVVLIGITNITGIQILVPMGKERWVLYSEIAGALLDLVINFLLIPRIGINGAAVGTLVAEIFVLCVQLYAIRDMLKEIFWGESYYKLLVSIIIASVSIIPVKNQVNNMILELFASAGVMAAVYTVSLYAMKDKVVYSVIYGILNRIKSQRRKENE